MKNIAIGAVAIAVMLAPAAHADDKAWAMYSFQTKNYYYMDSCNRGGQSPMTGEYMKRLEDKINDYAAANGFKDADINAMRRDAIARVNSAVSSGWLDGPRCAQIRGNIIKRLNQVDFWSWN
ncbi:hypothetical protein [Rhizobium viscosum]|uniref:Uncharacterized protein n=1 Tax=Rhizobium viscosum TaxID=1673 RepID=A0ABR9IIR9_RHIVS|nr:hypothetical protein [Rhizobium viscosum]MBE1503085.1 hypothetical protein [Rhizobium viscosum]